MIWVAGLVLLYRTLLFIRPENKRLALIMVLILALSPTWLYWAMKSRGGYLTAFTLSAAAFYLLYRMKVYGSAWILFSLGLLIAMISQSQLLWLPGIIAPVGHSGVSDRES